MMEAIETGRAVPITENDRIPSDKLARLLHTFAHRDASRLTPEEFDRLSKLEEPVVAFFYEKSGRESEPVPLFCLPPVRSGELSRASQAPLRVSLISMRHLKMDHMVDRAWIVNQKLLHEIDYWDKDQYCYKLTQTQLAAFAAIGVRHIHLYHTGYPAAMIGFYRALIRYQRGRPRFPIAVTPYDFDQTNNYYRKGIIWN